MLLKIVSFKTSFPEDKDGSRPYPLPRSSHSNIVTSVSAKTNLKGLFQNQILKGRCRKLNLKELFHYDDYPVISFFLHETWCSWIRSRKTTIFCIPLSSIQTCRNLMRNTNCFISYVQNCIISFQGGGGYVANATKWIKIPRKEEYWKKMIICTVNMYRLIL